MSGWGDDVLDTLEGDGMDGALAAFVEQLRDLADGPVPEPSAELAALLDGGVGGVEPWRRPRRLILNRLVAAAAAVVIIVGGAAAQRELPEPAQGVVSDVVDQLTPFHLDEWNWHAMLPAQKISEQQPPVRSVSRAVSAAAAVKPKPKAKVKPKAKAKSTSRPTAKVHRAPHRASSPPAVLAATRAPTMNPPRSAGHWPRVHQGDHPVMHRSWPRHSYGGHPFGDPHARRSRHLGAHHHRYGHWHHHGGHHRAHYSGHHRHW